MLWKVRRNPEVRALGAQGGGYEHKSMPLLLDFLPAHSTLGHPHHPHPSQAAIQQHISPPYIKRGVHTS